MVPRSDRGGGGGVTLSPLYSRGHVHMMSARSGGEGGTPKADAVRKLSKGGCVKMQTRGSEGVKKSDQNQGPGQYNSH